MKIALVNRHERKGGAARAAYRIYESLRSQNINIEMYANSVSLTPPVARGPTNNIQRVISFSRNLFGTVLAKLLTFNSKETLSPALLRSFWPEKLNNSDLDVVNLHWVNGEMISIKDISRIKKPIVWTLHDMWPFCGAEHYATHERWKSGYTEVVRPDSEIGFDLNRWVWLRKVKYWQKPCHIVTPSNWLAECVKKSALMKNWPVTVIHNAIDTNFWKPLSKFNARAKLGVEQKGRYIAFGAVGGGKDHRKGFDLLLEAITHLNSQLDSIHLIVLGQEETKLFSDIGFTVHFMGHISDESVLRDIYNASDVLVIPSRQDNLPNMGVEALSCGVPVVAFDTCGLSDLVKHQVTGFLAKPFDCRELAIGIRWVFSQCNENIETTEKEDSSLGLNLSAQCRQFALNHFSYPVVAKQYAEIFHSVSKK
ncbi:glycosyltransferase [Methylophaga sp.]|uniref:glycosyltransferase n=1 Tax=Methylophaga sp. TaxID=2024840 RepID=UPI0025F24586|nr:glycosyltransferase [Methylophaga sp.]